MAAAGRGASGARAPSEAAFASASSSAELRHQARHLTVHTQSSIHTASICGCMYTCEGTAMVSSRLSALSTCGVWVRVHCKVSVEMISSVHCSRKGHAIAVHTRFPTCMAPRGGRLRSAPPAATAAPPSCRVASPPGHPAQPGARPPPPARRPAAPVLPSRPVSRAIDGFQGAQHALPQGIGRSRQELWTELDLTQRYREARRVACSHPVLRRLHTSMHVHKRYRRRHFITAVPTTLNRHEPRRQNPSTSAPERHAAPPPLRLSPAG